MSLATRSQEYNRQRIKKDEIKQIRPKQLAPEEMIFSSSRFTREMTNATNNHDSYTGGDNEQLFTDAQLLARVGRGENWALTEIHNRYAGFVFSIALKTLSDQASAEEIIQQVFTKVWRHARDYRVERGKLSTWVSSITRHQCIDELRRRRVHPMTDSSYWESLDQLASNDDPAQDMQDPFEQARIREALQQIPTQQRIVIELAFWGGMTHHEIALHCHSPLGTVKTRLRLGMQRLRLLLQESA